MHQRLGRFNFTPPWIQENLRIAEVNTPPSLVNVHEPALGVGNSRNRIGSVFVRMEQAWWRSELWPLAVPGAVKGMWHDFGRNG